MLIYLVSSGDCTWTGRTGTDASQGSVWNSRELALSERSKATLLQMAHVWNRLADEHDRRADGDEAH